MMMSDDKKTATAPAFDWDTLVKERDELRIRVQELEKVANAFFQYLDDMPAFDSSIHQGLLDHENLCAHCWKDRESRCTCVRCDGCGDWSDKSKCTMDASSGSWTCADCA